MNASILALLPAIFSLLIYLFGSLKIEGSIRARFKLPLTLEVKVLYLLGVFLPVILLPFSQGGVVGGYSRLLGIEVDLDSITFLFLIAELTVFSMSSLYVVTYATEWRKLSLLLLMHSGLIGAFISKDLFNFYVFMELSAISSFALIASSKEKGSYKAAYNYLLLSMTASYLLVLSLGMIYFSTGTLNVKLAQGREVPRIAVLIASLALSLKSGIFPLHIWLPDAHSKADTYLSAILSGIAVKAPVYGLVLLSYLADLSFLRPLAMMSMIFGVVLAMVQVNAKRVLAYHTVSQMGYVLLAISYNNPYAAAIYSFAHAIFKSGLFLSIGALVDARKRKELNYLGCRNCYILLITVAILSLSIAGFGITVGGVAKEILSKATKEEALIYGVSLGTAFSFAKLNYYLWKGYGHKPSVKRVIPSLVLSLIALGMGIMWNGTPSYKDVLIPLGFVLFLLAKDYVPKRDYIIRVEPNYGVALLVLLISLFSIIT
ncbi:cation:proton antiporter [Pyrococcus furiosus DSM 3638]|uniref:Cation:proton antiporter n=3 Tax=Pyrococcus furiosus TaxID=2261 RepID=A0A5C0XPZ9_PYRFU|nr:monovalent cation/H+ antiporter subunit D family protein [Pyrococcus furiosus]AAL81271.1 putative multisubunit Na+/H+ antiporter [Pyrococcus furiosus DSM 3638]AFN03939.1 monovalent cation/H+ antiporter subunit D [Pyrococcus furiosus COM1]QEK78802.1 cation:proton antiporter [Pyrococcus furiosus DSM 3638]